MPDTELQSAPLSGVRVVDLTDAQASFSSRLLADLGAEVVKIEPPEGPGNVSRGLFSMVLRTAKIVFLSGITTVVSCRSRSI